MRDLNGNMDKGFEGFLNSWKTIYIYINYLKFWMRGLDREEIENNFVKDEKLFKILNKIWKKNDV